MCFYEKILCIERPCQELISKYLDEDEPMREWLSRMNTGKVLFQKRAFCGVFFKCVFVIIWFRGSWLLWFTSSTVSRGKMRGNNNDNCFLKFLDLRGRCWGSNPKSILRRRLGVQIPPQKGFVCILESLLFQKRWSRQMGDSIVDRIADRW